MPDVLLLPQVNLLQSNAHRSTVQKRSFNVIIAIYKQIYGKYSFTCQGFFVLFIVGMIFVFQIVFTTRAIVLKRSVLF